MSVLALSLAAYCSLPPNAPLDGDWRDDFPCDTDFGAILGVHGGVFAYSNCKRKCASTQRESASVAAIASSGVKWECVEYARRYWEERGAPHPATFASVPGAAEIWSLAEARLLNGTAVPLIRFANGSPPSANADARPCVGDLLIYPRQPNGFPYGHVAVIVSVAERHVLLAEQNWDNKVWPAPHHNYSRVVRLSHDDGTRAYTITEDDNVSVLGWVRYAS
ncbi:D-alanyl-glycyl endopeptidase-like protein [Trypanosoma vivax]|nr:D-alanyl-glycyl endopeptidase-like protein [Trypanosoma vivax]